MLTALASVVLGAVGIPLLLMLSVFVLELLAGVTSSRPTVSPPAIGGQRTVVLMPAHNEAKIISTTLARLAPRLGPSMELVVIADNCTDQTAEIVRQLGMTVVERHDPDRRGKGYALAHGVAALADSPPDCVIVIDADAWPEGDSLAVLAGLALASGRPVQGCFVIAPDRTRGPITRVSNFAHMLKNRVRQRGVARLAGTAFLCGSGMAFPWPVLAGTSLANGEIVEDLVFGIRLAIAGHYPVFAEMACVTSASAPGDVETQSQRRRWEHGFVMAARRFVPALLRSAVGQRRIAPLWMALHLLVPPLVLLLGLAGVFGGVALASAMLLDTPLWLGLVPLSLAAIAMVLIGVAWRRDGRDYLVFQDILAIPRYVASKLGIWRGLASTGHAEWNRTER